MGLKLTVPPTLPLVTLAEAKAWCNIDHDDDDVLVQAMIDGWSSWLDGYSGVVGQALSPQTYALTYDAFPNGTISLPIGPLMSVTSVAYVDSEGSTMTVPALDYQADATEIEGRISPVNGWPATGATINAVTITFQAGYALAACPEAIKTALKMLVSATYENRGAEIGGTFDAIPFPVKAFLMPYRRMHV